MLQKQNRFLVPQIIRWQYKIDNSEALTVNVSVVGLLNSRESFVAKMQKSGRIAIPKFIIALLKHDEPSLRGYAIEVTLEPT